jgi:thymidylate synthase
MNKWSNYGKWGHPKERNKYMNTLDKKYQDLLQDILDNGVEKTDRTGTGTISVFGRQIRHKMSEGFPLLTTKKMPFKTIVTELLWFLRGDTNIKFLVDNNCHIWDGDAYKNYLIEDAKVLPNMSKEKMTEMGFRLTQEEFINKIKTDNEFAKKWGELGPIYGKQWRSWHFNAKFDMNGKYHEEKGIDQIANLINDLKTNPDSRRLMVNAWNVGELDQMVLPPCHYGFQVYTRELSWEERRDIAEKKMDKRKFDGYFDEEKGYWVGFGNITPFVGWAIHHWLDHHNIPKRAISLMWNQRSVDTFLGLPFNIASYGLLLEIIAKEVNMVPDQLIGNLGDVHLYSNHIEQAKEQIGRKYTHEERTELLKQAMGEERYDKSVDELMPFGGGLSEYYDSYKIPNRTREPFPLPTLKIENDVKWEEGDCLPYYSVTDFSIENYQSHPTIKAPLSN